MAKVKSVHNDVLDGALNILKNGATQISVCTGAGDVAPATYAEATSTNMLAIKSDLTGADITVGDGTTGRTATIAQFTGVEVLTTGTAEYICLCDVDDRLLYVTTCTSQVLTDGNTLTIPAWSVNIADPV